MAEKITQTAGREQLGDFAPMFAHLNDDVHGLAERLGGFQTGKGSVG